MKSKLIQRKLEGPNVSTEELQDMAARISTIADEAIKTIEKDVAPTPKEDLSLNLTAYDIIKDPDKPGNNYVAVEIKYNLKTKKTSIISKSYYDKMSGMSMFMDKDNRKYLFEKNRGVKK